MDFRQAIYYGEKVLKWLTIMIDEFLLESLICVEDLRNRDVIQKYL